MAARRRLTCYHSGGRVNQAGVRRTGGPAPRGEREDQLRDVGARQKRLEKLLVAAYQALPQANHLDSIPGIGAVTAAVLTAFILDSDRSDTPGKLVAYFGALPWRLPAASSATGRRAARGAGS